MLKGMVHEAGGGVYHVVLEDGERIEASLRGRLKLQERSGESVVVGDRVHLEKAADGGFTIEEVLPRTRELIRRGIQRGGRSGRVLAANVDRMVIVVAAKEPEPRERWIDRLLVIGESNGLECVLVLNKMDLPGASERAAPLRELYTGVGYHTLETSSVESRGLNALKEVLRAGISVLVGPSGAGKSSLLNALEPGLDLRIGELSRKRGTGRHTTVRSRLVPLMGGGIVADTPGFADAGVWNVRPDEIDFCFPDFRPHLGGCRFRGCSHVHEPDCAVKRAVEEGGIERSRYDSYLAILQEVQESASR